MNRKDYDVDIKESWLQDNSTLEHTVHNMPRHTSEKRDNLSVNQKFKTHGTVYS